MDLEHLIELILPPIIGVLEMMGIFVVAVSAVRAFAAAGYRVAFSYCKSKEKARALEEELGGSARAFEADVADPAQVRSALEQALANIS